MTISAKTHRLLRAISWANDIKPVVDQFGSRGFFDMASDLLAHLEQEDIKDLDPLFELQAEEMSPSKSVAKAMIGQVGLAPPSPRERQPEIWNAVYAWINTQDRSSLFAMMRADAAVISFENATKETK